jgi:hypothetical protein
MRLIGRDINDHMVIIGRDTIDQNMRLIGREIIEQMVIIGRDIIDQACSS